MVFCEIGDMMIVLVIILVILFLPIVLRLLMGATLVSQIEKCRKIIYNDNDLVNYYSKHVKVSEDELNFWEFSSYTKKITDEHQYKESIRKITNDLYDSDRSGDKYTVNLLAKFLVKYYAEPIVRYGNNNEKKMLRNMAMLLNANGFIDKREEE